MSVHAIEITLLRPVTKKKLRSARSASRLPLVASADRLRLLTVVCAESRQGALREVWAALENLLPIDVLCTVYADKDGFHLLSVQVSEELHAKVRGAASRTGQSPDDYVTQVVLNAVARDKAQQEARLDAILARLAADFTPEQITAAAARRIALRTKDSASTQ